MNDLPQLLRAATDDIAPDPWAAQQAWTAAARGRRRRTALALVAVAASVVLCLTLAVAWPDPTRSVAPAPSPTTPTTEVVPDDPVASEPEVEVRAEYDPADWGSLPAYPVDLGHWPSPDRLLPLATSPVDRATAAVSFDLGAGRVALSVLGTDDRWRSVDVSGLTFGTDVYDSTLGLTTKSLSPDGTRVALGQPGGVVVVDLTSAERRTYPIPGLGSVDDGRETSWTADGAGVLLARSYDSVPSADGLAYQPGFHVDLATGNVTRLGYDPGHAAHLADGTVVADLWRQDVGHRPLAIASDGTRRDLEDVRSVLGAADGYAAAGQRWAFRREAMTDPDPVDGESGFMVVDGDVPRVLLPVTGVENHGGGGRVIGWLDGSTLLFAMPSHDDPNLLHSVAWDVDTGQLWAGPSILDSSRVSIAGQ